MKLKAFTLIELLITMTIIVLMAVVAIPNFSKYQARIDLQNKSDEIKAGIDGMQMKALNAEQGKTRYYAQITTGAGGKVEYGSVGTGGGIYKTVSLTSDHTLALVGSATAFLVCDKSKNYCCNTAASSTTCDESNKMNNSDFITITGSGSTITHRIFSNPFRVTTTP